MHMDSVKDSMDTPKRFWRSPVFLTLASVGLAFVFLYIMLFVLFPVLFPVLVSVALRAEPFDESNPEEFVVKFGQLCDINFPAHMESLNAAGRMAGGISPEPYVCFIRFTTNRAGFNQLRDSLSKLPHYSEKFSSSDLGFRYISFYIDTPSWYNIEAAKGIFYSSNAATGLYIDVVAAEPNDGELVEIFMDGLGDESSKERLKAPSTE